MAHPTSARDRLFSGAAAVTASALLVSGWAAPAAATPTRVVVPAVSKPPQIDVQGSKATLVVGETVTLKVSVKHGARRQKVTLQQQAGKSWKSVASKRLPRNGATKRVTFASVLQRGGLFRYRAKLSPLGKVSGATSRVVRLRVTVPAAPAAPPPPHVPVPLKFGMAGAAGLALPQAAPGSARIGTTSAKTAATGGLQTVMSTGATQPAITSGSADVRRFLIAPTGKVYVLFNNRVNLADTAVPNYSTGCLLAEVDPTTGAPTCIDSTLQFVNWMANRNPAIQFDASGAIYYTGTASGLTVLRRYKSGWTSDLISDNVLLGSFLVQPDGSVVVSGQTNTSNTTWTRRISPTGQIQTLSAKSSMAGMATFPDGNVYLSNDWRLDRFLTGSGVMDPVPWLTSSRDTTAQHQACPEPYACGVQLYGSTQTADGRVFAVDGLGAGRPLQVFPTVSGAATTAIASAYLLKAVGNHLLAAGTNGSGAHVLTSLQPGGTERVLLGASEEIEIYHLSAVDSDTVWFDGLRFGDNRVVVGRISLSTGAVTIGSTLGGKWEEFQAFAR